jgi:hypothetical protein
LLHLDVEHSRINIKPTQLGIKALCVYPFVSNDTKNIVPNSLHLATLAGCDSGMIMEHLIVRYHF